MKQDKIKINLTGVSETLLGPLWGRAKLSRERNPVLNDIKAIELVEQIDYDFSTIDHKIPPEVDLLIVARAKQFDDKIRSYIAEHPRASVINIGAGLDTTFYRVDNGTIRWYNLDLPTVIEIRQQLIPDSDRTACIAKSLFDPNWCKDIKHTEDGVFMVVGGVLVYYEESQVKLFFSLLADNFPRSEIVFDAPSRKIRVVGLSAEFKWALRDANKITKWDKRIKVLDQFPLFKNIPRDPSWSRGLFEDVPQDFSWSIDVQRLMDFSDRCRVSNIFHLRV
ncbi:MAG TPA: class I SAM-dependent methyltransferase [Candidatus Acidoferrales bacterium]|nr:class I SAM-dependent methyltransferase [Candidatus Acidoferrales bacterium]